MVFTKTISITVAPNLGGPASEEKVTLLLAFNDQAVHSEHPYSSTAWKVIPFLLRKQENQSASPVYQAVLGVSKAEVKNGKVVQAGLNQPMDVGQQTDLDLDDGVPSFSTPTTDYSEKTRFAVNNKLEDLPTIGAGIYDEDGKFGVISIWKQVPSLATVDIGFTPTLSIYATSHYVESQILPGHVESLLWKDDLNKVSLPGTINFELVWDAGHSHYILQRK